MDCAEDFLKIADDFKLGHLLTEGASPHTTGLSQMVILNPEEAVEKFSQVDFEMLDILSSKTELISNISQKIMACFERGGRLFLSGCGATGRLSLVIENIWRQEYPDKADKLVAFMAGGDLALIHSIEKFEDFPEYGKRQLEELGFGDKDLLLATTEGGETPWVIGTALAAEKIGGDCIFLFCNTEDSLVRLERCRQVFENKNILKANFTTGPQALTGSTRLQASSILTGAIGAALFHGENLESIQTFTYRLRDWYKEIERKKIIPFFQEEAKIYKDDGRVYYTPNRELAISVLTDTTERSPTFNLTGFDNRFEEKETSLCYLAFPHSEESKVAWEKLLYREPRPLEWPEVASQAGGKRLYGFDFSREVFNWRKKAEPFEVFSITQKDDQLLWELGNTQAFFPLPKGDRLSSHLILKMLLNMHSTLLMGLMGRYESNVMTFVKPSNNKLIDRATRYGIQLLKEKKGREASYEEGVKACFRALKNVSSGNPVVLEIVKELCS